MLFNAIGYVGAILYLLGYFLLSIRQISGHSYVFQLFNLFGAAGVTTAAVYNHDAPSILLNVAWGTIALCSLFYFEVFSRKQR
jgi:hypothetical protein